MKVSCKLDHAYLSGWKSYDVVLTTEFSGMKTIKVMSYSIMVKDDYSSRDFYSWAQSNGIDAKALFIDTGIVQEDQEKMNLLTKLINDHREKNYNEMCNNKCYTKIEATRNRDFPPLKTSFETIYMYDVLVKVEFNSKYGHLTIPVPAREKNDSMPFIMGSGPHMGEQLYEEKEAINYVESEINQLVEDCDTDEKLNQLLNKLNAMQGEALKALKK